MIKMYCSQYVKDPLILSYFNETWILSKFFFSENPQIPTFMSNHPVGAQLFHASRRTDGRTDMAKPIVPFLNFAKAPENCYWNL